MNLNPIPVKVRIHSVITDLTAPLPPDEEPDMTMLFPGTGNGEEPARETVSCTVTGRMTSDPEYLRVSYSEREDMGFSDDTTTTIYYKKSEPGVVTMVRTGGVSTAIRFSDKEPRQVVSYNTGIIPVDFVIHTNRIRNSLTEKGGELILDYDLEIRGSRTQRTLLRLRVTPEVEP